MKLRILLLLAILLLLVLMMPRRLHMCCLLLVNVLHIPRDVFFSASSYWSLVFEY